MWNNWEDLVDRLTTSFKSTVIIIVLTINLAIIITSIVLKLILLTSSNLTSIVITIHTADSLNGL